jgi:UDP-N-acetylglucosamine--N-acetylmuramyl-(pentapeptide) pyrophosphoryl-undecaprenol N-acetylglucosamine transferase
MTNLNKGKQSATRIIISGGGTGGHIFPAISIAGAIREVRPDADILFVGAEGRMEMQRVPAAGYRIVGLDIAGFDRKHLWKNFSVILKIIRSQWKARQIIRTFHPQVAVGVGGYASGPLLKTASMMGIPTLIQEQNSYAGVTNKLLAKKASTICVAYEGMERFFPAEKIRLTGNPVRQTLLGEERNREKALTQSFGLDPTKKTVLVLGGSLGARTINHTLLAAIDSIEKHPEVQFIWQTGKIYIEEVRRALSDSKPDNLYYTDFIADMASAYAAADLVVSRAGAGSISEFCLLGKPVILVPSPNVAEDHQTKNALALVQKEAALYVKDHEAMDTLIPLCFHTITNDELLMSLSRHIRMMGLPHAASDIAQEVLKLIKNP